MVVDQTVVRITARGDRDQKIKSFDRASFLGSTGDSPPPFLGHLCPKRGGGFPVDSKYGAISKEKAIEIAFLLADHARDLSFTQIRGCSV